MDNSRFSYGKAQNASFHHYQKLDSESRSPRSINGDFSFGGDTDRRFAYSRQPSFHQPPQEPQTPVSIKDSTKPFLSRTSSSVDIPLNLYSYDKIENFADESKELDEKLSILSFILFIFKSARSGNKQLRKLFVLISLNVAYSSAELCIGLFSGRVGLVSDAFHLTFGCGLLTFSLFAMVTSRRKPDRCYTYGYKRLEVLSAFTNALFLLFLSFSLAVEALHAFIQDESEHKHYLIVSAVTNLLVNLIGVWFFRNYARINLVYRNAEDMNYHSVCLHVLADSIRSAGLILASWLLALGVRNAEVLCLGLVSFTVFMLVIPLFKATGGILLQMAPPSMPSSALSKCWRQVSTREEISEVSQARFWELVPGHVIGSISLQVAGYKDQIPRAALAVAS
ncbi:metal tolerance protein C2 isoform X2 [Coffea arabica]|uniref:Metal tolerance protein C2 isoform X2 n=1 Tax=Coffea arabica TaxID=13443 RepID=A0ABM4UPH5_COFAR